MLRALGPDGSPAALPLAASRAGPASALPEAHGPQQRASFPAPRKTLPGPQLGSPGGRWPRPSAHSSATPHRTARAPLVPMARIARHLRGFETPPAPAGHAQTPPAAATPGSERESAAAGTQNAPQLRTRGGLSAGDLRARTPRAIVMVDMRHHGSARPQNGSLGDEVPAVGADCAWGTREISACLRFCYKLKTTRKNKVCF